jgi:uncharacterized protein
MSAPLPVSMTGNAHVSPRHIATWLWLAPRNAAIGVMSAYRSVISPLYGDVCKYYPSCSAYAVGALQQHGLTGGVVRTAARLGRCHPWARGGVDDVTPHTHFRHELTRHGFVVPASDERNDP